MRVLVAGASGLIGSHLVSFLNQTGHRVGRLVRKEVASESSDLLWNPAEHGLGTEDLAGADAVVCLSGANIAGGRWTPERKRLLRESRIQPVALLSCCMAAMEEPPGVLICASAVGFYGSHRGQEILSEEGPPGDDFLARLCVDWEAAAAPAREKGVRVIHLRFGLVLSRAGGALPKLLLPFKLGLGGVVGDGRQYMSWLSLDEAVSIIDFALQSDDFEGVVNAVSPRPVTNREFTSTLSKVLRRPAFVPVPKSFIRLAFGEMGEDLLLAGQRAIPGRLEGAGYRFRHPDLRPALEHVLRAG